MSRTEKVSLRGWTHDRHYEIKSETRVELFNLADTVRTNEIPVHHIIDECHSVAYDSLKDSGNTDKEWIALRFKASIEWFISDTVFPALFHFFSFNLFMNELLIHSIVLSTSSRCFVGRIQSQLTYSLYLFFVYLTFSPNFLSRVFIKTNLSMCCQFFFSGSCLFVFSLNFMNLCIIITHFVFYFSFSSKTE